MFLVNELAETDVDAAALRGIVPVDPESIVGGSLFCECKAGDFVRILRERVLPMHENAAFDAMVIETSGMADPGGIGTLLRDHGFLDRLHLAGTITIAAPQKLPSLLKNLPVAGEQIRHADLVVINKCDLATMEQVAAAVNAIRSANPIVPILKAAHADIPVSEVDSLLLPGRVVSTPCEPLSECDANPFTAVALPVPLGWSPQRWWEWLEGLPPRLLRLKGVVASSEGLLRLEKTIDSVRAEPISEGEVALVAIVHDSDEEALLALRAEMEKMA